MALPPRAPFAYEEGHEKDEAPRAEKFARKCAARNSLAGLAVAPPCRDRRVASRCQLRLEIERGAGGRNRSEIRREGEPATLRGRRRDSERRRPEVGGAELLRRRADLCARRRQALFGGRPRLLVRHRL